MRLKVRTPLERIPDILNKFEPWFLEKLDRAAPRKARERGKCSREQNFVISESKGDVDRESVKNVVINDRGPFDLR